MWKIQQVSKKLPKVANAILIEGLPGIGDVGKVAVDFMIEELGAILLFRVTSFSFPHSVFVNEEGIIELPMIEIFHKSRKGKPDLFFLVGDVQPLDERSAYEFCDTILTFCKKYKIKEIVTIGGIGLPQVPSSPKVYCAANNKSIIKKYQRGTSLDDKLHGIVGPIIGVTGILVGLAADRKIPAICLLAETYGHPLYLGIKGSQAVLQVFQKTLEIKLNLKALNKEIAEVEAELKKTQQLGIGEKHPPIAEQETNYIG